MVAYLQQRACTTDLETGDDRCLGQVGLGHEQRGTPGGAGGKGHGKSTPDRPQISLEADLADHERVGQPLAGKLPAGDEDAQRDGQVEGRAVLADVGGGQIDSDAAERELKAGVGQGRADPFPALLDRSVGQPNGGEGGQAAGDVDLDVHGVRVDSQQGGGTNAGEHGLKVAGAWPGTAPGPRRAVRNFARFMQ